MKKILITGGTGFVGKALFQKLLYRKYLINLSTRKNQTNISKKVKIFNVGELSNVTDWTEALCKVDCVIHCAGRAHIMKKSEKNTLELYRKINVDGTLNLAKQSIKLGVKRFIFLSSIKVNGEKTFGSSSFKYDDIPKPEDPYGISKWEAEKGLWEVSRQRGLEVVIIRAPLIYGYGVKGNLARLIKLVNSRIPLPFNLIKNERSLIGIDNLVDFIIKCIVHPKAKNKTFLVSDDEDLSTVHLLKYISLAMGKSTNLFPFPLKFLKILSFIFRKQNEIERLLGSLKIDNSYAKNILNWTPPVNVEEGIRRMVLGK